MTGARFADHRGLVYDARRHFLDIAVPLIAAHAVRGERVVLVLDEPLSRAVRERLDPGARAVSYLPEAVPAHDSPVLGDWIRALDGPTLVLGRFTRADRAEPPDVAAAMVERSVTLVCTCSLRVQRGELVAFRSRHPVGVDAERAPPTAPATPDRGGARACLASTVGDVGELHDLRVQVGNLAALSGFTRHGRRRAVLAVHEAVVLAFRLLGDPPVRCDVRVFAGDDVVEAEIDLPRTSAFPADLRDHDPLQYVRAFAPDTGWTGTLRTRRLRVAARNDR